VNLLLDTHTLVWWLVANRRLGRRAREAIVDPDNEVWISAATIWEIAIKTSLERLDLGEPPETCLPRELRHHEFRELPVTPAHAYGVRTLPWIHKDPFDRLLVSQAKAEGLTLVTSDRLMTGYGVELLVADA
jgi:PIN domain nuclease of toxin-antitoxin system